MTFSNRDDILIPPPPPLRDSLLFMARRRHAERIEDDIAALERRMRERSRAEIVAVAKALPMVFVLAGALYGALYLAFRLSGGQ